MAERLSGFTPYEKTGFAFEEIPGALRMAALCAGSAPGMISLQVPVAEAMRIARALEAPPVVTSTYVIQPADPALDWIRPLAMLLVLVTALQSFVPAAALIAGWFQ